MKTLVERIRNRELAINNNGSLEELRKVLKHCFPKDSNICSGYLQDYYAKLGDNNKWDYGYEIDLPTVSVKEVLAEIEGECKETKVIYLNEEDRPKIEEPLSFKSFILQKHMGSVQQHYSEPFIKINGFKDLNKLGYEWLEYRNNFNHNDKPIELKKCWDGNFWVETNQVPSYFENIWYRGDGLFWCWTSKTEIPCVFKGNLNNGKVK